MTFADRLEELKKAATGTPWKVSDFAIKSAGDEGNTYFICFLVNNADAILELVRAAEVLVGHADGDDLEAELRAVEALAKLNGEQT